MTNLPSGTVTFLYTDIESSTLLWEQQPNTMAAAIESKMTRPFARPGKRGRGDNATASQWVSIFVTTLVGRDPFVPR